MTNDFYLTLPSNASMKMYPDNTLAHYITDLPQRIDLTGEWECGLTEILGTTSEWTTAGSSSTSTNLWVKYRVQR